MAPGLRTDLRRRACSVVRSPYPPYLYVTVRAPPWGYRTHPITPRVGPGLEHSSAFDHACYPTYAPHNWPRPKMTDSPFSRPHWWGRCALLALSDGARDLHPDLDSLE
jgi:hypothetical protein